MNTILNRILLIFLTTIIILINSVIWFIWQLDLNDYRTQISKIIAAQTGWRLKFSGNLKHRFVTKGFWLLIKDVQMNDPRGQFIDIEWLQAKVSLNNLFERYILIEDLELTIRSCDIQLRPEIPPPLPITLNMDAKNLNLIAKDCHVLDVESQLETVITNLMLTAVPMPIIINGWIVAGMPAGIINAKQNGTIQANTVAFGDVLGLNELKFDFVNDHGHISIPNLTTKLQPLNPLIPSLSSPQFTISTQVHLGFNETHQELFRTLWKGVDDVWLAPFQAQSENLNLIIPTGTVYNQNLTIAATGFPLLIAGKAPTTWIANSLTHHLSPLQTNIHPHNISISGTALWYENFSLTDYFFNIKMQPGQIQAALEHGIINVISITKPQLATNEIEEALAEEIITNHVTANVTGKIDLALDGLQSNGTVENLQLKELQLNAQQLTIDKLNANYQLANADLTVQSLPIIHDGVVLNLDNASALLHSTTLHPTINLTLRDLNHKEANIESLFLKLITHDDVLSIQQLEMNLAGTKMAGNGMWRFNNSKTLNDSPWSLQLTSNGIAMQPLLDLLDMPLPIQGNVSVDLNLNSSSLEFNSLIAHLNGNLKMVGQDLKILTADVNAILTHLETSRSVGLLDLGAYILLGPAGILVTKGTQYSALLGSFIARGNSQVTNMNTALRIESGVVRTEDVALATTKHRLALAGTLDLREKGLANLQVATVDAKGCAKYVETIDGSGRNPQVNKTGIVINSLLNPVNSVVGTLLSPVIGGCFIPFYSGQVPPP